MNRRGAILLELLLAVVLFAMAGLAIHGALDHALDRSTLTAERLRAADLAWSAISLIESGVVQPESIDGPIEESSPLWMGPPPGAGVNDPQLGPWSGWGIRVETEPTQFRSHMLVSIGVVRSVGTEERLIYTARQIVRIGNAPAAALPLDRQGGDA
ncbi:MAG: hypothetical protein KF912_06070 [Phycisphaeraceae bacterium]|nr:hypothetical protein [Phycisphaeraceae bacterium]